MKLYRCKYCDVEVKFRDAKCPACGRKIVLFGKRFTSKGWALYLVLFILGLALIFSYRIGY